MCSENSNTSGPHTRWRKILYKRQPYADNYVGEEFLEELRKNEHLTLYSLSEAVTAAAVVVHQLSCVILLVLGFRLLTDDESCDRDMAYNTLIWTAVSVVSGRAVLLVTVDGGTALWATLGADVRLAVVFVVFGGGLSPLLATLTDSISTDTVHALFTLMMFVHLITHNYGAPPCAAVSSAVSLNAALFAALCLASRFSQSLCVFSFLTLATLLFALVPLARTVFWKRLGGCSMLVLCSIQCAVTITLVSQFSAVYAALLSLLYITVCPLTPLLYVFAQRFKQNINGPWDEAVLQDMDLLPCLRHDSKPPD